MDKGLSSFLQSETNVFCNGIWKCTWNVFLFADLYWFLHNGSLAIKTKTKTKTKQQKRVYTFRGVAANLFTSLYYKMICRILLLWSLSDKNIDKGEQKLTSTTTKQPERCLFNQKKKKNLKRYLFVYLALDFSIWNSGESKYFHLFPSGQYVMKHFLSCLTFLWIHVCVGYFAGASGWHWATANCCQNTECNWRRNYWAVISSRC